jgi:hypothetical protein
MAKNDKTDKPKEEKALKVIEEKAVYEAPPKPKPKKKEGLKHYTIGTWKGKKNYSCKHCPFETLHEKKMQQHVIQKHLTPRTSKRFE